MDALLLVVVAVLFVVLMMDRTHLLPVTVYNVTYDEETQTYECCFIRKRWECSGYFDLPEGMTLSSLKGNEKFYVLGLDCSDGYYYLVLASELEEHNRRYPWKH